MKLVASSATEAYAGVFDLSLFAARMPTKAAPASGMNGIRLAHQGPASGAPGATSAAGAMRPKSSEMAVVVFTLNRSPRPARPGDSHAGDARVSP